MYPRIPRELFANPLGFAEHTLGTTVLNLFTFSGFYVHFRNNLYYRHQVKNFWADTGFFLIR